MNTRKKRVGIILLLVIAAILAYWFLRSRETAPAPSSTAQAPAPSMPSEPDVLRFRNGAPQLSMIQAKIIPSTAVPLTEPLSARLAYDEDQTARIGVAFSGRIVALKAAPGDTVKAGQVLAEIDSPDYGAAFADLNKARADENRKRLVLERAKELVAGEGIAAKDVEAAQADYSQARAETARTEQRLKSFNPHGLAIQGQRLSLASPMNGVVAERTATPSLEVSPGMSAPLFVITDPKRLWVLIDLPEKLLGRVKLGSAVAIESDAFPSERFSAKIVQLGQVVDPNSRRVAVRARLENADGKLLPEMFVRASVLQEGGKGVRVPNSAIVNRGVYAYVFVQTAPAEFRLRQVTLLTRNSDFSYVGEGLQGDERVVTKGALLLDAELSTRAGSKP